MIMYKAVCMFIVTSPLQETSWFYYRNIMNAKVLKLSRRLLTKELDNFLVGGTKKIYERSSWSKSKGILFD